MITFPSDPTVGQIYVADNTISYLWTGNRWSAFQAIQQARIEYYLDGLYPESLYDPLIDKLLDGGEI